MLRPRLTIAAALIVGLLFNLVGCSYDSFDKPIRFYRDREDRVEAAAPYRDRYFVLVQDRDGTRTRWRDVDIPAERGDPLGFEVREDGNLVALAHGMPYVMGAIPPDTHFIAWATKERRAGFTQNPTRDVAHAALGVAVTVALASAAVVGGAGLLLLAISKDRDDEEAAYPHP